MAEKLVVGPITKGLRTGVTPFNVDNDSFPTLINAYQWRGRVKRKRGTSLLCRLRRNVAVATGDYSTIIGTNTYSIFARLGITSSQPNASIVPGNIVNITIIFAGLIDQVLTDTTGTGVLTITNGITPGAVHPITSATINYSTGIVTITANAAVGPVASSFSGAYYPDLPVMGLEDVYLNPNEDSLTMAFDTIYSYLINRRTPFQSYDVSFYKNISTGSTGYPGYIQKTTWTPLTWNGQDYQQFWTVNYQGALWATNGVTVPFSTTNIGMQYKFITGLAIVGLGTPPAIANITITAHGLVVGDFIFINEVNGITGINFQTGYVIAIIDANTVQVEFPNATLAGAYTSGGIAQYLTSRSDTTKDCIRWFDGDPTGGPTSPTTFQTGKGWVNFMPPLSKEAYSIADLPPAIYYLVGAKMIVPFKDRLIFLGPVVQTSAAGSQVYLQDTVIYSQNGTPYYTASFTGDPSLATTINSMVPLLVPVNQTASPTAWWEDQTGFGGFLTAGVNDAITTSSFNEDVVLIGFTGFQTRFVYSGNDIVPFNFYSINSELGSASTFSSINMDKGVITKGSKGYILTSQVGAERIDVEIPDQVFEVRLNDNGNERVCAQRDFLNEWLYFTYPSNNRDQPNHIFPNQTLFYNYRDNSYAIFNECYTTYGQFRKIDGFTWATIGDSLSPPQWSSWNTPWNSGQSTALQPDVIAGNQQGFVMVKDDQKLAATGEGTSLYIQSISGNTVTSPNHCLNDMDFIYITGALGTVGTQINVKIFQIYNGDANTFQLSPSIVAGTYIGGGLITRMYVPFIQTRQFPVGWDLGRKVQIGSQLYLLTKTPNGQITVQIYLSQNDQSPYNNGPVVPAVGSINNSLIYSNIVNTCPEVILSGAFGISLGNIGDGVTLTYILNYQTIFNLAARISPGTLTITIGTVATFTDDGIGGFTATGTGTSIGSSVNYDTGVIILSFTVAPSSQASTTTFYYEAVNIISPSQGSQSQIWHKMNTSLIGDTVQLGFTLSETQMRDTSFANQFTEIELHGFTLDIAPSQVLA